MIIKEPNVYVKESEKMEELDLCLSRYGEVSSKGRKYQKRIFLTGDDLPISDAKALIGMIKKDVGNLKLSNLKFEDKKKHYFHYHSDHKHKNGEMIPYLDIELVKNYD